jgi:hypothetical protein
LLGASALFPQIVSSPRVEPAAPRSEPIAQPVGRLVNEPALPRSNSSPDDFHWVVPVLLLIGIIVGIAAALAGAVRGSEAVGRVRVVALPPGEAPEEIRGAWIGLELPVAGRHAEGGSQGVSGVLSNQPAECGAGYAVDGAEAVRILAAQDPEAAAWWRSHAPHVLGNGYQLVFPAEVCEQVG